MACYFMRPDFAAQMGRTALRKGRADSGVEKLWVLCMFTLFLLWVSSAEGRILRAHHSQGKQSLYTHRNGSSPTPAQPAAVSPSPDLKKSSHSSGGSDCSIDDLNECTPPMDPTFGSYKRLVPNGPNPLHNR